MPQDLCLLHAKCGRVSAQELLVQSVTYAALYRYLRFELFMSSQNCYLADIGHTHIHAQVNGKIDVGSQFGQTSSDSLTARKDKDVKGLCFLMGSLVVGIVWPLAVNLGHRGLLINCDLLNHT